MRNQQDMTVQEAIRVLTDAGAVFLLPQIERKSLSLSEAGERLGFSGEWVREHLNEFPNAWRAPGGGANGGELRIPVRDLDAFERRLRLCKGTV